MSPKTKNLVSVIITTKNEEQSIARVLKSIKNQSYKKIEIIVVDNFSTDSTKTISKKFTKNVFSFGPERSAQRNFGVKKARGEFVLIIDADMVLTKKVIENCVKKMADKKGLGGLVIPEKSFGKGFWAKCKAFERQFYLGDENIEAARFFKKKIFKKFGGYDTKITGPEDWDLPLRMKKSGVLIGRIESFILHNEKKFSPWKSAKKKFYYALHSREYLKRHPEMMLTQGNLFFRPKFYKNLGKLTKDPLITLGFLFTRFLEMSGAFLGITLSISHR